MSAIASRAPSPAATPASSAARSPSSWRSSPGRRAERSHPPTPPWSPAPPRSKIADPAKEAQLKRIGMSKTERVHPLRPAVRSEPEAAPASPTGQYPRVRLRRNRTDAWTRRLVAEHRLGVEDLIWPVFVHDEAAAREPIGSIPGIFRHSIPALVDVAGEAAELGIPALALFPVVPAALKSPAGDEACRADNLCNRAIRAIKQAVPGIGI